MTERAVRYRITVGTKGSPARGEDRAVGRPRSLDAALARAKKLGTETRGDEFVWVWAEVRPDSWEVVAHFHRGLRLS